MPSLIVLIVLILPLSCVAASDAGVAGQATGMRAALQAVGGGALAGLAIAVLFFLSLLLRRPGDTSWSNHAGQSFLFASAFGVFAVIAGGAVGVVIAVMQWSNGG